MRAQFGRQDGTGAVEIIQEALSITKMVVHGARREAAFLFQMLLEGAQQAVSF